MKPVVSLPISVLLLAGVPGSAAGQAIVEYSLGAARAATMAAPAKNAGKGIGAAFDRLNQALGQGKAEASSAQSTAGTPGVEPAKKAAKPAVVYEDPAGIKVGMEYAELIRRFGEPSMKITSGTGQQVLSYMTADNTIDVELRGGRVASVQGTRKKAPETTGVRVQQ